MSFSKSGMAGLCVIILSCGAAGQITGSGTTNQVPKFTGTGTIGNSVITESNGNVGIGTTTPGSNLDIEQVQSQIKLGNTANGYTYGLLTKWTDRVELMSSNDITFATGATSNVSLSVVNGNVGIGIRSPGQKLEINGNMKFTAGSGASLFFADGTSQTTAWTGALCGGDYAESINVSDDRTRYQPGDVLVIDDDHPGNFLKSEQPYSIAVAGIYSTKPGLVGRRQKDPKTAEEIPMAMIGIVPVKVSTENGPIRLHDLLVSSSTPGYAMKGTDRSRLVGAVIGKAMGSLDSGTGIIEVLVTLQ